MSYIGKNSGNAGVLLAAAPFYWSHLNRDQYVVRKAALIGGAQPAMGQDEVIVPLGEGNTSIPGRGHHRKRYDEIHALFRRFMRTPCTPEGVLDFAGKYGLLGIDEHVEVDGVRLHGERLQIWYLEITYLRNAWQEWEAADKSDPAAMLRLEWSANFVAENLADRLLLQFRVTKKGDGLEAHLRPRNLLGLIWLQFATAVITNARWGTCAYCGEPFPKHDARAMYCSKSHKTLASQRRKESKQ